MDDGIYQVRDVHDAALPHIGRFIHAEWTEEQGLSLAGTVGWCAGVVASANEVLFAARSAGKTVGCACLVASDLPSRPELTPWLSSVYVAPHARGQGLASALVAAVDASARERGHRRLYLFTPAQTGPVAMYARRGWEHFDVGEQRGQRIVIMCKALPSRE